MAQTWYKQLWGAAWLATAGGLIWALLHVAATTDGRLVVEGALQQAQAADLDTIRITLAATATQPPRPPILLVTRPALVPWVPALHGLRPTSLNAKLYRPQPVAVVEVVFAARYARAWHLRQARVTLYLASSNFGYVVERAGSALFYRNPVLVATLAAATAGAKPGQPI